MPPLTVRIIGYNSPSQDGDTLLAVAHRGETFMYEEDRLYDES